MCEPATIIMGVTAVMGAVAAKKQADYGQDIANNNAIISQQKADDALERGEESERRHREQVEALKGQQRSALAANGVVLDDGSALDILADTAEQGELDALTIRHNAQSEATDYLNQAGGFSAQGEMASYEGTANATASIIGGAGSVADKWYSPSSKAGKTNKDLYGTSNPSLSSYAIL